MKTHTEIREHILAALREAGIDPGKGRTEYDDTTALVSLYPERRWKDGLDAECSIAIYEDAVEKRQRNTPFNHTQSFCLARQRYDTVRQMVEAVKEYSRPPVAGCWK